jgi:hypothetical protein
MGWLSPVDYSAGVVEAILVPALEGPHRYAGIVAIDDVAGVNVDDDMGHFRPGQVAVIVVGLVTVNTLQACPPILTFDAALKPVPVRTTLE